MVEALPEPATRRKGVSARTVERLASFLFIASRGMTLCSSFFGFWDKFFAIAKTAFAEGRWKARASRGIVVGRRKGSP